MTGPHRVKASLTLQFMPDNNTDSDASRADGPPKDNNQETENGSEALADAIVGSAQPTPVREGHQDTHRGITHGPVEVLRGLPTLPSVTGRDTDTVTLVMLLRLLSYDQLRRLVFPSQDGSVLRHARPASQPARNPEALLHHDLPDRRCVPVDGVMIGDLLRSERGTEVGKTACAGASRSSSVPFLAACAD